MSTFAPLTDAERDELTRLVASGQPLPECKRGGQFRDAWSDEEAAFQSLDQVEQVRSFVRLKLGLPAEDS